MIEFFIDILQFLFFFIGTLLFFTSAIGLIRLPDVYTRMHAATIGDTLGLGMIIAGAILEEGATLASIKMLIIIIFVFLTNPTAAHAMARAAYKNGVKLTEKSVVDEYEGHS